MKYGYIRDGFLIRKEFDSSSGLISWIKWNYKGKGAVRQEMIIELPKGSWEAKAKKWGVS